MISHKMELRADQMAQSTATDTGAYASALARLYEDSLAPAVNAVARATHPHLYDRMLAAGVTPNFPRPAAPKRMALHGHFFAGLVGRRAFSKETGGRFNLSSRVASRYFGFAGIKSISAINSVLTGSFCWPWRLKPSAVFVCNQPNRTATTKATPIIKSTKWLPQTDAGSQK